MNDKLKIVFMGTPEFAVNVLDGLIKNYDVKLVVSQPDKEVGRKRVLTPTPVKVLALENGIEVFQPINIKNDYQRIIDIQPDLIITCAYGQIVPDIILNLPKYGAINVHASLLPKLRGGAPIHRAIINGHSKTGITIMYMVSKMDAGDIISQVETEILDSDNLESLHDRLSLMGSKLLLETIPLIENGNIRPIPQDPELVTYAWNIKREEEVINFNDTARNIFNKIRGLAHTPGAYSKLDGKVIKIFDSYISDKDSSMKPGFISSIYNNGIGISTTDKEIVVTEIQIEGKKKMLVKDYFNGIDRNILVGKEFKGE